jgi:hypothetical protein
VLIFFQIKVNAGVVSLYLTQSVGLRHQMQPVIQLEHGMHGFCQL